MALGQRTNRTTPTGHCIISLRVGPRWQDWCLANQIPEGQPDFGIFEYTPEDQFCFWRDPQLLTPNVSHHLQPGDDSNQDNNAPTGC